MRSVALALGAAFVLALGGCGGDDDEEPADQGSAPQQEAKQGGDLVVMYAADVDKIDPGQTYYQYGMNVAYATQRPLYSYKPDDASNLEPDLAEGPPEIAEDGKSVTVKIRTGVKFSPPVNREVTSADVKYGLERGFLPTVAGPYVGAYMGSIKGLKAFQDGKADEISGIKTPDDQTIDAQARRSARRDRGRRAVDAGLGARAEGVRAEVRQAAADRVRREPGRDRPVHGRGRRVGQAHRLHAGDRDQARAQPQLGRVDRLQARLRRLDHDQGGQRPRRRLAPDPRGPGHGVRRLPAAGARSSRASRRATRRT